MSTIADLKKDEAVKFSKVNWTWIQYYENVEKRKNPDGSHDDTYAFERDEAINNYYAYLDASLKRVEAQRQEEARQEKIEELADQLEDKLFLKM